VNVIWLPEAKQDLERLHAFLFDINPPSAANAMQTILDGSRELQTFPKIGKPMDDDTARREHVLPFGAGAYILRYKLHNDQVVILRVWHSRENR